MSGSRIKQKGARRCFEKHREDPKGSQPYTYVDHMDIAARKWDWIKNTWLPKKGKGFHATHRASYGFSADSPSSSCAKKEHETVTVKPQEKFIDKRGTQNTEKKQRREKRKPETGWFQIKEDRNTNVYVTGLPPDVTKDEFIQLMSKCGIIMKHPQTEEHKIKLYKDAQGNLKGDGLCCYLKKESVSLALKLLDDDEIRGHRVHVEKAKFQLKGEYDASKKKKKGKDDRKKISLQKKKLNWPEKKTVTAQMRPEQVVIIRNMFHPKDFEKDPSVLNEIKEDLQTECKKFGQLSKVLLFDRHPDGVASVTYKKPEEAYVCIQALNGRWFGGRQLNVKVWDGVTDYQVEEIPREKEKGLKGLACFFEYSDIQRKIHASGASFAFGSMTLAAGEKF